MIIRITMSVLRARVRVSFCFYCPFPPTCLYNISPRSSAVPLLPLPLLLLLLVIVVVVVVVVVAVVVRGRTGRRDGAEEDRSHNAIIIPMSDIRVRAAFRGGGGVSAARLSQESHGRPITVIRSRFPIPFRGRSHRRRSHRR